MYSSCVLGDMRMQRTVIGVIVILAIVSAGLASLSCSQGGYSGKAETINFGANSSGSCALVYIAQEQGFFAREGLSVNVKDYSSGVAAINAALNGEMDIIWSSEFPLVRAAFAKEGINVIAVINRFSDQYILGSRASGVNSIADLKGKEIGVPRNTISEFYLSRFLMLNGISISAVSLIDVLPAQAMEAISNGSVDAVVVWEPYSTQMKTELGDKAVNWSVQSMQQGFGIISARSDWLARNPDIVVRFLRSLVNAEDYLTHNTKEAQLIIKTRLNIDATSMGILLSESQFSISLEESLIIAMEDEARWMMKNNMTTVKEVPNLLDYIYADGLKLVKPGAVQIPGE